MEVRVDEYLRKTFYGCCFILYLAVRIIFWKYTVPASWRNLEGLEPTDDNIRSISLHSAVSAILSYYSSLPHWLLFHLFTPLPANSHPCLSTQLTQNLPSHPTPAHRPR